MNEWHKFRVRYCRRDVDLHAASYLSPESRKIRRSFAFERLLSGFVEHINFDYYDDSMPLKDLGRD